MIDVGTSICFCICVLVYEFDKLSFSTICIFRLIVLFVASVAIENMTSTTLGQNKV